MSEAEMILNQVRELLDDKKIIVVDGELYKYQQNYGKLQKLNQNKEHFLMAGSNNETITVYLSHIGLVNSYEPQNSELGYTKIDLVDMWIEKNKNEGSKKLFNQALEKAFYKNEDGSICFEQLQILAWKILFLEKKPLTAKLIKDRYLGLHSFWHDNLRGEYSIFVDFLVDGIGIPKEFVDYKSTFYLEQGDRWDQKIRELFECCCKDYLKNPRFTDSNNRQKRPDGLLLDINTCIDFKLSFLPKEKLISGKEFQIYSKEYNQVIVLHLMGPRETIRLGKLLSMNVYDWILENKDRFDNYEEVLKKVKMIEKELETPGAYEETEAILIEILNQIKMGNVTHTEISRKLNFKWTTQVISGNLYAHYPLTQEIKREYSAMSEVQKWKRAYYVIDCLGQKIGPFIKHKDCIEEMEEHFFYLKFDPIFVKGIQKGLSNYPTHLFKGYFFVYEKDLESWEKNMEEYILEAKSKFSTGRFSSIILVKPVGRPIDNFYLSRKDCARAFGCDPRAIRKSITGKTVYKNYQFFMFSLREYSPNEYIEIENLYEQESFVHMNMDVIKDAIRERSKDDFDFKGMTKYEIDLMMRNILDLLKKGYSLNSISEELGYSEIHKIVNGFRNCDHKLSEEIQLEYKRQKQLKEEFYVFNCLGECSGPFYTSNYEQCIQVLKEQDRYFKFLEPQKNSIKKAVNGEFPSVYGYCFVKSVSLEEWLQNKDNNLSEAKRRLRKSSSYYFEMEPEGDILLLKEAFDNFENLRNKINVHHSVLRKSLNSKTLLNGKKYVIGVPRLHSSDEIEWYTQLGVEINSLLNEVVKEIS